MLNHKGDALIAAATRFSSNVVVVMHIPGVADVEQWADNPNVTAIVAAWMPGQESGDALVSVLYGDVNPSGKLPFTWGKSEDDYPVGFQRVLKQGVSMLTVFFLPVAEHHRD